jgi:hypothetical protein
MKDMSLIEIALEIKCLNEELDHNQDRIIKLSNLFLEKSFSSEDLKKIEILIGHDLHPINHFASAFEKLNVIIDVITKGGHNEKII